MQLKTLFLLLLLPACFTQVSSTNRLAPGMSAAQVRNMMGEPSQTQFIADKWVWKYSLHQPWKGFIPYYLVFGSESQQLEGWVANEQEYMQQQALWLATWNQLNRQFPPKQKIEVKIKRK